MKPVGIDTAKDEIAHSTIADETLSFENVWKWEIFRNTQLQL